MSIVEDYTGAVYKEQGFYAAYPPYAPISLGDFGLVQGRCFRYIGNIGRLSTPIPVHEDGARLDPARYRHEFKVKQARAIKLGAGARFEEVIAAKASLAVEFASGFGAYVALAGATVRTISNLDAVGAALCRRAELSRDQRDYWDAGRYSVVTQLIHAEKAVVVMSAGGRTKIVLEAKGDVPNVDLTDVRASFRLVYDDTSEQQFYPQDEAPQRVTPFMWLMKVDTGFLGLSQPELVEQSADASRELRAPAEPPRLVPDGTAFDLERLAR